MSTTNNGNTAINGERFDAAVDAASMARKGASFPAMRSDLVTSRETIRRAISGEDADLTTAAGLLDAVLAGLCPHDVDGHHHTVTDDGEQLTTCTACGVSWFTANA